MPDMFRFPMLLLTLTVAPFADHADTRAEAELAGLPNVSFPAPRRVASGRRQAMDMAALKRAGIEQVIDLSVDSETPEFDEGAAMRAAGIGYQNLPIRRASDLTRERVIQFERLLKDAGQRDPGPLRQLQSGGRHDRAARRFDRRPAHGCSAGRGSALGSEESGAGRARSCRRGPVRAGAEGGRSHGVLWSALPAPMPMLSCPHPLAR